MSDASPDLPATPPVLAPAAPPPAEPRLPFWTRVSDRMNPILIRETQQAVNGRTFLTALSLALGAIVLVSLTTSGSGGSSRREGWSAFVLGMQVLLPLLCLVVPLQAFLSTRHEVSSGTIEHLLLSRLTPAAVVRGKIAAAAVEAVVFLSVFAPLLALTYLLRGVDVPTIAVSLGLVFLYGLGAVVFAVAMGAVCRWPGLRALPLVVVALGLTLGTGSLTLGMHSVLMVVGMALRSTEMGFHRGVISLSMPILVTAPFLFLLASAALAHPHENRSTPFRVFAVVALLGTATWAAWIEAGTLHLYGGTRVVGRAAGALLAVGALVSAPFWIFAVTEEETLSPRVRTLVPRRRLFALLSVPFLPGGGRGLLFTLLLAGIAFGATYAIPALVSGDVPNGDTVELVAKAWCYVLIYASLAKLLRNLMPAGGRASGVLRAGFPVVVAFIAILPAVFRLLAGGHGEMPLLGLNPFAALSGRGGAADWVLIGAPVLLVGHVGSMVAGVREVLQASAGRRARAA